jgi:hypothetical protein
MLLPRSASLLSTWTHKPLPIAQVPVLSGPYLIWTSLLPGLLYHHDYKYRHLDSLGLGMGDSQIIPRKAHISRIQLFIFSTVEM